MQNIYIKTYFPKQGPLIATTSIILASLLVFGILAISPPKAEAVNTLSNVTASEAAVLLTGANLTVVPGSALVYGNVGSIEKFDSVNLGGSRTLANAGIYLKSAGNTSGAAASALKTTVGALPRNGGIQDVYTMSALEYSVTAAAGITSVSLQYLFGSNESYNANYDVAAILVDGVNWAKLANGTTLSVHPNSGLTRVNPGVSGFYTSCWTNTYTMVGLFNMALTTHKIQIVVADTGDPVVPSSIAASLVSGGTATSGGIAAGTAPGAPNIGIATATGQTTASVAFTAPASNGGSTITSYTATSLPAGGTGTLSQAGSGSISVTGLSAGVDYTFTVTATNSSGTSPPSAASNSMTTTQPTATSGQLPSVIVVDPQTSSLYLPTTVNTAGPTNLLLCLNESDANGTILVSPTINFDVAANGGSATTAGTGTSTISDDRTTATYIYGTTANVISTLNSVLGTQIYLSSGAFSATKYIKIRAISIASSSSRFPKTCASTVYTSQNIEIRPLVLQRIMKKGTITLKR
jgi:hypothetical protein